MHPLFKIPYSQGLGSQKIVKVDFLWKHEASSNLRRISSCWVCLFLPSCVCTVHHSKVKLTHLAKLKPMPKPGAQQGKNSWQKTRATIMDLFTPRRKGKYVLLSICREKEGCIQLTEQIFGEMLPSIECIPELPMIPQDFLWKDFALRDVSP